MSWRCEERRCHLKKLPIVDAKHLDGIFLGNEPLARILLWGWRLPRCRRLPRETPVVSPEEESLFVIRSTHRQDTRTDTGRLWGRRLIRSFFRGRQLLGVRAQGCDRLDLEDGAGQGLAETVKTNSR